MKSKVRVAIAAFIAVLLIAAVACGGTQAASPNPSTPTVPDQMTTADLTHGAPQPSVSTGSPEPSLTFGGVDYVHSGAAELPSGEGTVFVIDGIEITSDSLETVGTTDKGNTPGIQGGLVVYRLKTAGTNEVYTFNPGKDHVNPEDGLVFKGQDVWTRWTSR